MSFFLEPWSYPSVHRREKLSLPDADLKKKKKRQNGRFMLLKLKGKINGTEKIMYFIMRPKY